jgi:hypothetical protein
VQDKKSQEPTIGKIEVIHIKRFHSDKIRTFKGQFNNNLHAKSGFNKGSLLVLPFKQDQNNQSTNNISIYERDAENSLVIKDKRFFIEDYDNSSFNITNSLLDNRTPSFNGTGKLSNDSQSALEGWIRVNNIENVSDKDEDIKCFETN